MGSRVAALRVEPDGILESIERLCDLAGMSQTLDRGAATILKDNISWHFPFPAANTTPWQLEVPIVGWLHHAVGKGAAGLVGRGRGAARALARSFHQ